MTSRERLLTTLDHQAPDRVPIDLGGNQTGIHKFAYANLLRHLGIDDEVTITDAVQQLAQPCEAVLERFHVDTRYVAAGAAGDWKGGIVAAERDGRGWHDLTDEFGVRWSMPDDAPQYMDITLHPLAEATVEDIADYPFPRGDDPGRFVGLRERALAIRDETPYAVVSGISGVVYEICWYLRGLEQWFVDLMTDRPFCEALHRPDAASSGWTGSALFLDEAGDVVDVIMIGDDLAGADRAALPAGDLSRRSSSRGTSGWCSTSSSRTKAKIWYHTCGSCAGYIPDLLDNGIDILNPVQISAEGMDPRTLKERFGDRLTFWGGAIDAQHILPSASPERVREEVRRNLEAWKPGGGYVFNNVHNLQADVPPENIVALYDAAYEYGFY